MAIQTYFHSILDPESSDPVFPKDPRDLYNALKQLEIGKLFTKEQKERLFPSSQETNSDNFDPSLFKTLIANFSGVKSKSFWTSNRLPETSDTSDEANIFRLFFIRNDIQHSPGYISTVDYHDLSQKIIDTLVSLGYDRAIFDNLLPPKQYCLTKPVANFCGRNDELKQIHDIVKSRKNSMLQIVIHGMSGLGKSELIRKYCDEYGKAFDKNILWIDSRSTSTLESSFRDIAETILKLEIKDQNGRYKENHFIVDSVHQYFRSEKVLYVFDDVENIKKLEPFLPNHPDSYCIITSQLARWPNSFDLYELKKLDDEESESFLNNNLKDNVKLNAEQTTQVCKILQGHCLALQQFVASINNTLLRVDEYIKLVESKTAKMLKSSFTGDKSTTAAIQINMERLKTSQDSNLAYEILNHLAYFNGDEINFDILKVLFPEHDDVDLETAVQKLSSYSLINIRDRNIINIHSLIHETLKYEHDNMSDREIYRNNCIKMFQNQLDVKEEDVQHSQFAEKWYQQFIYFISLNIDNQNVHEFMLTKAEKVYDMLSTKGKYEDLIRFFERMRQSSHSKHGEDHKETISAMYWMAFCYHDIGKFDRSIELTLKLIPQQEALFGEDHRDTMRSMNLLALCYKKAGKLREAFELYKKTMEKRKLLFGEYDRDTLQSMSNLAESYRHKGMLKKAIELNQKTFKIYVSKFGEDHRDSLILMNNLACCYKEDGKLEKAAELFEKTLEKNESSLGEVHNNTLTTMRNLAECFVQKGMHEKAIELHKNALEKFQSPLGEDHRHTLTSMNDLAYCYKQTGMLEEAIALHIKTMEKRKLLFGKNDRDTSQSMNNLAESYRQNKQLEKAIELHKKNIRNEQINFW